jgi:Tfp pilus assembly protein PilV
MVALVIFSVVIMSLVGLSFQVARHSTRSTDQALTMAVLLAKVDQASTAAYDSLTIGTKCDTTLSGLYKVIGCSKIDTATVRLKTDSIKVWTKLAGTDTVRLVLQRGKERRPVPLR